MKTTYVYVLVPVQFERTELSLMLRESVAVIPPALQDPPAEKPQTARMLKPNDTASDCPFWTWFLPNPCP